MKTLKLKIFIILISFSNNILTLPLLKNYYPINPFYKNILKPLHIHFIGIAGRGMSGLAKILKYKGCLISGCDWNNENPIINDLLNIGCKIFIGNNTDKCSDKSINAVIYSTAINSSHPELISAKEKKIPILHRAALLNKLTESKKSIAFAGSHGKTTTSALVSHILIETKQDPTMIIGGYLNNISNNARLGQSNLIIIETDEHDYSLKNFSSDFGILTNIDLEHLETLKSLDNIKNIFTTFLNNLKKEGKAIICIDDKNIQSILPNINKKIITYGIDNQADIYATDLIINPENSIFKLWYKKNYLGKILVSIPGKINILNSLAAIAVCLNLGISFSEIQKSIKTFKGVKNRFSYSGNYKQSKIYQDVGHHPTQVKHVINIVKKYSYNQLHIIFKVRNKTAINELLSDFINTLIASKASSIIITEDYDLDGEYLVKKIKKQEPKLNIIYESEIRKIIQKIDSVIKPNDIILIFELEFNNNCITSTLLNI